MGQAVQLKLTERQQAWVRYVSAGVVDLEAAKLAGYAAPTQAVEALHSSRAVQAALRHARQQCYNSDLAFAGVRTLREVMADTSAPAAARVRAAQVALQLAGDISTGKDGERDSRASKALHEMNREELALEIARARAIVDAADAPQIEGSARIVPDQPGPAAEIL